MTISYNADIVSSSPVCFIRILKRWKGSVWKSVAIELTTWSCTYIIISLIYRYLLTKDEQKMFETLSEYCRRGVNNIPLTFLLGFFVNVVVQRWIDALKNMGYLENQAIHISSMILGEDDQARLLRRTIARYLCLAQVLVYRDISVRVRKRFPTYESIVKAGFLLENEKIKIESYKLDYDKYWVPINWTFALVIDARKEGLIMAENYAIKITDEIRTFRNNLQMLCNYDWVQIPLVYPQAVFLSVHTYFTICLIGRQMILVDDAPNPAWRDVSLPIMTMLQYVFIVGWMKVAEGLLNPFGEDDDDFECNFLIDKNFSTTMYIVDEGHHDVPPLEKDKFWLSEEVEPIYSKEAAAQPIHPMIGSAARASSLKKVEEPEMTVRKYPKKPEISFKRTRTSIRRSTRNAFQPMRDKFRRFSTMIRNKPTSNTVIELTYNGGENASTSSNRPDR